MYVVEAEMSAPMVGTASPSGKVTRAKNVCVSLQTAEVNGCLYSVPIPQDESFPKLPGP